MILMWGGWKVNKGFEFTIGDFKKTGHDPLAAIPEPCLRAMNLPAG
jgi:hypothetical protein